MLPPIRAIFRCPPTRRPETDMKTPAVISLALCALLLAAAPARAKNECDTAFLNEDWKAAHQACCRLLSANSIALDGEG